MESIISFDLDGTLFDPQERIHPSDLALLKNPPPGCVLLPTTGRPLFSVKEMFARNGLFGGQKLPWPLVMQNGAAIYRSEEQILEHLSFSSDVQSELITLALKHPKMTFFFMDLAASYTLWPSQYSQDIANRHGLCSVEFTELAKECHLSRVLVISDQESEFEAFEGAVRPLPVKVENSLPGFCEISPPGVGKGPGLLRLLDLINLTGAKIFAAGDGENDLSTFEVADFRLAPTNAQAEVRARADRVIERDSEGLLTPLLKQAGVLEN